MKKIEFQKIVQDPTARMKHYQEIVGTYYDLVSDFYRQNRGESFHFAIFSSSESLKEAIASAERMIANAGRFKSGMKILDVGCGIRGPALNIAEYSRVEIAGVNINEHQVKITRQKASERGLSQQVKFVKADAMEMPFAGELFDVIYIFEAG